MKLDKQLAKTRVVPGKKMKWKHFSTDIDTKGITREEADQLMQKGMENLRLMHDKLYASNSHSLLVVIQAMDAAGKDSAVKHVLSGLNPTGVKVYPFKAPTHQELDHDYLWRHNLVLPARGEIGIFVRSHYENVLVCRVHPEFVLKERIPGVDSVDKVNSKFFRTRFRQINDWERHLTENGTTIVKIFLYQSADEQRKQLLERIDDPAKNWKFELGDLAERKLRPAYLDAYEDLFNHTSTEWAPWHIVPADDKWFARLLVGGLIYRAVEGLNLQYPAVDDAVRKELQAARKQLLHDGVQ